MDHRCRIVRNVLSSVVALGATSAVAQPAPTGTDIPDQCPSCPPPASAPAPVEAPAPAPARSPEPPPIPPPPPQFAEPPPLYVEEDRYWERRYGLGISAGGGVSDWTDDGMRDVTGAAGTWEVRGYVGLTFPIAGELAYVGQASSIGRRLGIVLDDGAIATGNDAFLIGNGVDAVARLNIVTEGPFQPYLIAGLGWKRYTVTNADFDVADFGMNDSDNVLEVPVGGGLAYRSFFGMFADARFTFRGVAGEDLVIGLPDDDADDDFFSDDDAFLPMHSWEVSGRIGYEF